MQASSNIHAETTDPDTGTLTLILGPMFSGKTTKLIQYYYKHVYAGQKVAIVAHESDKRYALNTDNDAALCTHLMTKVKATFSFARLIPELAKLDDYDVVLIDEGQFFPDLVFGCAILVGNGKHVVIAALDTDHEMHKWENVAALVPDSVRKLSARCGRCGRHAGFTCKIGGNADSRVEVGSTDMYLAVCRACHPSHKQLFLEEYRTRPTAVDCHQLFAKQGAPAAHSDAVTPVSTCDRHKDQ